MKNIDFENQGCAKILIHEKTITKSQTIDLANRWGNTWQYIQYMIENKLKKIIQYEKPDNKLYRLSQEQTKTPEECHSFYPRIVNNTDITFSKSEITLLEKGLKYNLHKKKEKLACQPCTRS